jgi:hypothetical protein
MVWTFSSAERFIASTGILNKTPPMSSPFLNQYTANDIQTANGIISYKIVVAFVKKVWCVEPLWKTRYLDAFSGEIFDDS